MSPDLGFGGRDGGFELAEQLEAEGYAGIAKELGLSEEELAEVEGSEVSV